MVKWKYKVEEKCPSYSSDLIEKLNEYGKDGWEIVHIENEFKAYWPRLYKTVYLKKKIKGDKNA
ncbi:MAG: hypothetical protein KKF27_20460 [Gammaproteobacteria bacterium]|nr:hypothetical protein [Gammaproteobacteria bacterium]MBU2685621.1 hypothetical protein [Gammaproteobacteria bacterium]